MPATLAAFPNDFSPPSMPGRSPTRSVETLYGDHHGWLLGWLRRKLGHAGDVTDLAQDTFVRVLGRARDVEEVRAPRAWLTTIAHGLVVDHVRRRTLERAFLLSRLDGRIFGAAASLQCNQVQHGLARDGAYHGCRIAGESDRTH